MLHLENDLRFSLSKMGRVPLEPPTASPKTKSLGFFLMHFSTIQK